MSSIHYYKRISQQLSINIDKSVQSGQSELELCRDKSI